ncbi:MAG TPA: hypothetical protein VHM91_21880, partial [Verrucomicrobiales bacterium]|jgi:hypothetical protein|nr:hypothetical protein [Verrucomicrobiales bacterium]
MKTTFALLTAFMGTALPALAGPGFLGGAMNVPVQRPAYAGQPAGSQCAMTKTEIIETHGRGGGPVVSKKLNCTGQKCCAANVAACCAVKR